MTWIVGIALGILVGYLLDREVYFYEGVHLGPRVQAWLYDRWAKKYDAGKRESQQGDDQFLARPLLTRLNESRSKFSHREHRDSEKSSKLSAISVANPEPFILDFATGTGRLSFALLDQPDFNGHIIAVDLSRGMLEQAATKIRAGQIIPHALSGGEARREVPGPEAGIEFLRHVSLPLPFADATFDAVCALEVLELFPNIAEAMKELTRVLRPGGILLTSRGTEASGRTRKIKSAHDFGVLLLDNGYETFEITPWWKFFDRVIAEKNGSSEMAGRKVLSDVLPCGVCNQVAWKTDAQVWRCQSCGNTLSVTNEGIVLN